MCKDPEVRKLLDQVINNDSRISFAEIVSVVALVLSDRKVTMQEVNDLKTILEFSKSLDSTSRSWLQTMEVNLRAISQEQLAAEAAASTGTGSAGGAGMSQTPTQKANREFFAKYPERNNRPIQSHEKAAAREWMAMYRKHGGK